VGKKIGGPRSCRSTLPKKGKCGATLPGRGPGKKRGGIAGAKTMSISTGTPGKGEYFAWGKRKERRGLLGLVGGASGFLYTLIE